MQVLAAQAESGWNPSAAYVSLFGIAVSLIALLLLHIVSREFEPSWRMVSEYANGSHRWLLTRCFSAGR